MPFRHLPPTAVPITPHDLSAGLRVGARTVDEFRAALAAYLGISDAFLAASGRTALYWLLRGLQADHPRRTRVVMPAYTCPAVAKVTLDVGLQPVFVDLEPRSMTHVPTQLETAVDETTLAVMVVHPFGIPQDVEPAGELARAAGAVVIEDAAQALGAGWGGRPVGLQGDFGLYSLGPGKPLSTGGGGVVVARTPGDTERLAHWWSTLPQAGGLASAQALARQAAFQAAFHPTGWWAATRVGLQHVGNHEASWGYALRGLTPAQAGVGLSLLPRLDAINTARRRRAVAILANLDAGGLVETVLVAETAVPIYLRLPLLARDAAAREHLFAQLWDAGIGVGRLYPHTLPSLFPDYAHGPTPGADAITARLLTLPTHHHVTDTDITRMRAILLAG